MPTKGMPGHHRCAKAPGGRRNGSRPEPLVPLAPVLGGEKARESETQSKDERGSKQRASGTHSSLPRFGLAALSPSSLSRGER